MIIDAWMQHPNARWIGDPMFGSLRRAAIQAKWWTTCAETPNIASCSGSNHPFWPAGDCIEGLDKLQLGETSQVAFLESNAKRMFKLAQRS
ncbi:hypothetical protein [Afipia clevelandensis]|uniref:Amidohydrolase-related domain-containing protein n=1 Tax=Afipia clevelandensis ATCC 49720 TaxID=883079 RepID=K8P8S8_9BRAD|nr:hypothetical protein [Afipia clevelandensis]EKS36045.1 hypothetical protein HMPREF9696_02257 [Afipia clevelandensis ATCC 49720]